MGYWGTGPMDGDTPMDLRGNLARLVADRLRAELRKDDDGSVFAAAHLALTLVDDATLGIDYDMFWDDAPLWQLIEERVRDVKLDEGWIDVEEREKVRRQLLDHLREIRTAEKEFQSRLRTGKAS